MLWKHAHASKRELEIGTSTDLYCNGSVKNVEIRGRKLAKGLLAETYSHEIQTLNDDLYECTPLGI